MLAAFIAAARFGWLVGWLGGWVVGWVVGWVLGWLAGWLQDGCWIQLGNKSVVTLIGKTSNA